MQINEVFSFKKSILASVRYYTQYRNPELLTETLYIPNNKPFSLIQLNKNIQRFHEYTIFIYRP